MATTISQGIYEQENTNQGLWNIFEKKKATTEQAHDLLHFRSIGQETFENLVKYRLLKDPSTNAPMRMKRLNTFTIIPTQKQRVKLVEKERKLSQRFLKRQLTWATENQILPTKHNVGSHFYPS